MINNLFRTIISISFLIFSTGYAEVVELKLKNENPDLARTLDFAKGNHDFKNLFFREHEQEFIRLVRDGQTPKTCFIGCSDSRVIPELISQTKPGDLFVIRTAGNFVPLYDLNIAWDGVAATIEYAVEVLGVKDIIVCGHSHCGAIQGLFSEDIEKSPKYQILSRWLQFGEEAKRITNKVVDANAPDWKRFLIAERISILAQLDHLLSYPFIKQKVAAKEIYLHGWYFKIETGEISYFDPEKFRFLPISTLIPTTLEVNGLNRSQDQEQKK